MWVGSKGLALSQNLIDSRLVQCFANGIKPSRVIFALIGPMNDDEMEMVSNGGHAAAASAYQES
jgi:hypothetical protein